MVFGTEAPPPQRAELNPKVGSEILAIREKRALAAARMRVILSKPDMPKTPWGRSYARYLSGVELSEPYVLKSLGDGLQAQKLWLARSRSDLSDDVWLSQRDVKANGRPIRGSSSNIVLRTWGQDVTYDWGRGPEQFEAALTPDAQLRKIDSWLIILDCLEEAQAPGRESIEPVESLVMVNA